MWLDNYSVTHYRPHKVANSDINVRYTVKCEVPRCPWIVRVIPWKGGPTWHVVSCVPSLLLDAKVSVNAPNQINSHPNQSESLA